MATQIRPNRLEVSDRFPMLGFTVRTDGDAKRYEIAIGTSPDLFGPDGKSRRSRDNFFSTRASGPLPIERGEAVYVVPPEVLIRFVGQQKIYYGLATFNNGSTTGAAVTTMPGDGSPYVNVGGLTGRSLQRVRVLPNRQRAASSYGKAGLEIEWAGDAMTPGTQPAAPPAAKNGNSLAPAAQPVHYDDGYGPLPVAPPPVASKPRAASMASDIALDTPLYPGVGGQSNGMDALHVGGTPGQTNGAPYHRKHRHTGLAHTQGVLDWARGQLADLIRAGFNAAPKKPYSFPKIQILDSDDAQTMQTALQHGALAGVMGSIQQVLDKQYSIGIGGTGGIGAFVGVGAGAGVVLTCDGHFGVYGEAQVTEGMFERLAAHLKVTLVKGGVEAFNGPTVSAGVELGAPIGGSIEVLGDAKDILGIAVEVGPGEEIGAFLTQGVSVAVQLFGEGVPARMVGSMPRAGALKQVDPGYTPGNAQDALQYMKQFQDRKQAWTAGVPDTTFFPHSAICRLRIFQADGEYIGTGFYIGNDRILTCAHNVVNATGVTIIPGKNDSAEPFGSFSVRPADWAIHPKYDAATADSSATGHDFDLAVIKTTVAPPGGQAFTILEELLQCQESPIIVCGYAADTVDPDKQHLDGDEIRQLNDSGETVLYNLQTEPGNSGSPVYYVTVREDDERQQSVLETRVVGVHVSSDSKVFNQGCRLTAAKIAWINSVGKPFSAGASAASLGYKKRGQAAPVRAQAAPASTTSGVGVEDDARRTLKCIQGLTDQGRPITFVQRYLRSLDNNEATALSTAGLKIVSCYQVGGGRAYFTQEHGQRDGRAAYMQAQRAGQPEDTPIYFAFDDFDGDGPRDRQIVLDYITGVHQGCEQYIYEMQDTNTPAIAYDIGVYGGSCVLDWCKTQGNVQWFWQAFAPAWCQGNNRAVWEGANLRTTQLDDQPRRCNGKERLDYLEGWGNEGGWTVAAAAQGQALSVSLPAPPPKRRYAQGQAADMSPRMIGNSPINVVTGGEGNITWELEQFPGVKTGEKTGSPAAVAPMQSAETIKLTNWPYCDHANGTRASAWFTVDWKFSGQNLGQVRIAPAETQQGAQPLRVEARIEDGKHEDGKNKDAGTVSLVVRFTYRFSTPDGPAVVAVTELTLYSDGTIDQKSNWMAQAAA